MKFERAKEAATILADILNEQAPFLPKETLVSYVPTATSRVRQRGYDQAKEIAESFAKKRNLKLAPLLYRDGQARQVGSDKKQRLAQLEKAFRARNADNIRGAKVVLIDDIVTTGATLEAAGRLLKKAGARTVNGLAVAQKQ